MREYKREGWLYPLAEILQSQDFSAAFHGRGLVLYTEAGMFVRYLIDTDTIETILPAFEAVFGASLTVVEAAWHEHLDSIW